MTKLETATHVCLIAICCLAGGLLIEQRFFPPRDADPSAGLAGRKLDLPGANWGAAPFSVLLEISSTCRFCQESVPFYRQLLAERQARAAKVPVIVASSDAVGVIRQFLADQQVAVDQVLHAPPDAFGGGTPTIYLVDSCGFVKRVFIGELDSSGQKELLSILARGKV